MNDASQRIADIASDAAARIRSCQDAPAGPAKESFAQALQQLVRARNDRMRALAATDSATDSGLQQLNAILSLMAGIEFPLGGFHRERLGQVEQALHSLANANANA